MRVAHLPVYSSENPYQSMLMNALKQKGLKVIEGGGGGNFLRTAITDWKADILHFHWLHPYLLRNSKIATMARSARFITEVAILKGKGARIVWTIHNLKNHDNRYVQLERSFSIAFAKLCSGFIVHSNHAKNLAMEYFRISDEEQIHVVPHGNYIDYYPNRATRSEARKVLNIADDKFVALFLGRIQAYKGVVDLIKAFKIVSRDAVLIIAGKPATEAASRTIQMEVGGTDEIIYRPGFVPDDQIQFYMNASDIVVFPYREILTSGAVMLAMSFGRPCLAPSVVSIREMLDERGAIFFDPQSRGTLEIALKKTIDAKTHLSAMGQYNFDYAEQWGWKRIGEMTSDVYAACQ